MIKNSQPFGKKFLKTVGGIFFDSHCRYNEKQVQIKTMITITIAERIITILLKIKMLSCTVTHSGDWYLLRAKFRNDSNFLVCEIARGRGVEERSLEMAEVLWEGGRR